MMQAECSIYGCTEQPEALVANKTTERLDESWTACLPHVGKVLTFIVERDVAWGITQDTLTVVQVSRA